MKKRLLSSILSVALLIGAAVSFLAIGDISDQAACEQLNRDQRDGMNAKRVWFQAPGWNDDKGACVVDSTPDPVPTSTPTPVPMPEPESEIVEVDPEPTPEAARSTQGTTTSTTTTTQAAPKQAPAPDPPPTPTATPNPVCEDVTHYTFQQVQDGEITNEVWSAYRKGPCFLPASEIEGGS